MTKLTKMAHARTSNVNVAEASALLVELYGRLVTVIFQGLYNHRLTERRKET